MPLLVTVPGIGTVNFTNTQGVDLSGFGTSSANIPGTAGNDTLLLNTLPNGVQYSLNGGPPTTLTGMSSIEFDGGPGSNALVVDAASTGVNAALVTRPGRDS